MILCRNGNSRVQNAAREALLQIDVCLPPCRCFVSLLNFTFFHLFIWLLPLLYLSYSWYFKFIFHKLLIYPEYDIIHYYEKRKKKSYATKNVSF